MVCRPGQAKYYLRGCEKQQALCRQVCTTTSTNCHGVRQVGIKTLSLAQFPRHGLSLVLK